MLSTHQTNLSGYRRFRFPKTTCLSFISHSIGSTRPNFSVVFPFLHSLLCRRRKQDLQSSSSKMDFHGMKHKSLQALCKKHKLPANGTSSEIANRLTSHLKKPEEEEEPKSKKVRFNLGNEVSVSARSTRSSKVSGVDLVDLDTNRSNKRKRGVDLVVDSEIQPGVVEKTVEKRGTRSKGVEKLTSVDLGQIKGSVTSVSKGSEEIGNNRVTRYLRNSKVVSKEVNGGSKVVKTRKGVKGEKSDVDKVGEVTVDVITTRVTRSGKRGNLGDVDGKAEIEQVSVPEVNVSRRSSRNALSVGSENELVSGEKVVEPEIEKGVSKKAKVVKEPEIAQRRTRRTVVTEEVPDVRGDVEPEIEKGVSRKAKVAKEPENAQRRTRRSVVTSEVPDVSGEPEIEKGVSEKAKVAKEPENAQRRTRRTVVTSEVPDVRGDVEPEIEKGVSKKAKVVKEPENAQRRTGRTAVTNEVPDVRGDVEPEIEKGISKKAKVAKEPENAQRRTRRTAITNEVPDVRGDDEVLDKGISCMKTQRGLNDGQNNEAGIGNIAVSTTSTRETRSRKRGHTQGDTSINSLVAEEGSKACEENVSRRPTRSTSRIVKTKESSLKEKVEPENKIQEVSKETKISKEPEKATRRSTRKGLDADGEKKEGTPVSNGDKEIDVRVTRSSRNQEVVSNEVDMNRKKQRVSKNNSNNEDDAVSISVSKITTREIRSRKRGNSQGDIHSNSYIEHASEPELNVSKRSNRNASKIGKENESLANGKVDKPEIETQVVSKKVKSVKVPENAPRRSRRMVNEASDEHVSADVAVVENVISSRRTPRGLKDIQNNEEDIGNLAVSNTITRETRSQKREDSQGDKAIASQIVEQGTVHAFAPEENASKRQTRNTSRIDKKSESLSKKEVDQTGNGTLEVSKKNRIAKQQEKDLRRSSRTASSGASQLKTPKHSSSSRKPITLESEVTVSSEVIIAERVAGEVEFQENLDEDTNLSAEDNNNGTSLETNLNVAEDPILASVEDKPENVCFSDGLLPSLSTSTQEKKEVGSEQLQVTANDKADVEEALEICTESPIGSSGEACPENSLVGVDSENLFSGEQVNACENTLSGHDNESTAAEIGLHELEEETSHLLDQIESSVDDGYHAPNGPPHCYSTNVMKDGSLNCSELSSCNKLNKSEQAEERLVGVVDYPIDTSSQRTVIKTVRSIQEDVVEKIQPSACLDPASVAGSSTLERQEVAIENIAQFSIGNSDDNTQQQNVDVSCELSEKERFTENISVECFQEHVKEVGPLMLQESLLSPRKSPTSSSIKSTHVYAESSEMKPLKQVQKELVQLRKELVIDVDGNSDHVSENCICESVSAASLLSEKSLVEVDHPTDTGCIASVQGIEDLCEAGSGNASDSPFHNYGATGENSPSSQGDEELKSSSGLSSCNKLNKLEQAEKRLVGVVDSQSVENSSKKQVIETVRSIQEDVVEKIQPSACLDPEGIAGSSTLERQEVAIENSAQFSLGNSDDNKMLQELSEKERFTGDLSDERGKEHLKEVGSLMLQESPLLPRKSPTNYGTTSSIKSTHVYAESSEMKPLKQVQKELVRLRKEVVLGVDGNSDHVTEKCTCESVSAVSLLSEKSLAEVDHPTDTGCIASVQDIKELCEAGSGNALDSPFHNSGATGGIFSHIQGDKEPKSSFIDYKLSALEINEFSEPNNGNTGDSNGTSVTVEVSEKMGDGESVPGDNIDESIQFSERSSEELEDRAACIGFDASGHGIEEHYSSGKQNEGFSSLCSSENFQEKDLRSSGKSKSTNSSTSQGEFLNIEESVGFSQRNMEELDESKTQMIESEEDVSVQVIQEFCDIGKENAVSSPLCSFQTPWVNVSSNAGDRDCKSDVVSDSVVEISDHGINDDGLMFTETSMGCVEQIVNTTGIVSTQHDVAESFDKEKHTIQGVEEEISGEETPGHATGFLFCGSQFQLDTEVANEDHGIGDDDTVNAEGHVNAEGDVILHDVEESSDNEIHPRQSDEVGISVEETPGDAPGSPFYRSHRQSENEVVNEGDVEVKPVVSDSIVAKLGHGIGDDNLMLTEIRAAYVEDVSNADGDVTQHDAEESFDKEIDIRRRDETGITVEDPLGNATKSTSCSSQCQSENESANAEESFDKGIDIRQRDEAGITVEDPSGNATKSTSCSSQCQSENEAANEGEEVQSGVVSDSVGSKLGIDDVDLMYAKISTDHVEDVFNADNNVVTQHDVVSLDKEIYIRQSEEVGISVADTPRNAFGSFSYSSQCQIENEVANKGDEEFESDDGSDSILPKSDQDIGDDYLIVTERSMDHMKDIDSADGYVATPRHDVEESFGKGKQTPQSGEEGISGEDTPRKATGSPSCGSHFQLENEVSKEGLDTVDNVFTKRVNSTKDATGSTPYRSGFSLKDELGDDDVSRSGNLAENGGDDVSRSESFDNEWYMDNLLSGSCTGNDVPNFVGNETHPGLNFDISGNYVEEKDPSCGLKNGDPITLLTQSEKNSGDFVRMADATELHGEAERSLSKNLEGQERAGDEDFSGAFEKDVHIEDERQVEDERKEESLQTTTDFPSCGSDFPLENAEANQGEMSFNAWDMSFFTGNNAQDEGAIFTENTQAYDANFRDENRQYDDAGNFTVNTQAFNANFSVENRQYDDAGNFTVNTQAYNANFSGENRQYDNAATFAEENRNSETMPSDPIIQPTDSTLPKNGGRVDFMDWI